MRVMSKQIGKAWICKATRGEQAVYAYRQEISEYISTIKGAILRYHEPRCGEMLNTLEAVLIP